MERGCRPEIGSGGPGCRRACCKRPGAGAGAGPHAAIGAGFLGFHPDSPSALPADSVQLGDHVTQAAFDPCLGAVFRAAVHQAGPKALQLTVTQKAWKECNFLVSISYVKPPTASCCSEEVFGAMKVKHNENQTQLPISASIPRFLRASREGPLPRAFRPPTLSLSAFKGLLKQHFLQEGFLLLLYGPQS
ncbi:uncharacterized protein [Desmodus rotundus]|uniref:uncharacterized protein isoform X2 n=1 Tax=Desmodus rotundus TaxID=9430 RepID=UPI002380DF1A|nr:uncharacterized protein LOC123478353 isoform X3 [Desmodus rotundus]